MSIGEALDLIGELHHERSHFAASAAEWARPASMADLHLQLIASAVGVKVPWPWDGDGPPATPEELAEAEEVLARFSAIPS